MNNFEFYSPTEFIFGRDTQQRVGQLASAKGATKVLIVYGSNRVIQSGLMATIETSLREQQLTYALFGGIAPNPTDDKVYEGIAAAKSLSADFILAVGGGSVIDTAKAIAAGVPYEGDFWDFFSGKSIVEKALPVGVVLTIPAAGSEGSGNSVITQKSSLKKVSMRTPRALRPSFAVMNPELTFTLSPYQTAAGAVDMMAHIMERYFTQTPHTEVTDGLSEALLCTIRDAVPRILQSPTDYDARAALMWSGTLAHNGLCGTGNEEDWSSHALEHELSAFYNVTHGAGLAVIFPAWLTYVSRFHADKPAQFAYKVWNVVPSNDLLADALEGIRRFRSYLQSIGMPTTIEALGIDHFELEKINEHVHEIKGQTFGAFVSLDAEATREIYRLATADGQA